MKAKMLSVLVILVVLTLSVSTTTAARLATPANATAVTTSDMQQVIQAMFQTRANGLKTGAPLEALDALYADSSQGQALRTYEEERVAQFHKHATQFERTYVVADDSVTVNSLSQLPDGTIEAKVTESLGLGYEYPQGTPGGGVINYEGYGMYHDVTLVVHGSGWIIASDNYVDGFNPALAADHVSPSTEGVTGGIAGATLSTAFKGTRATSVITPLNQTQVYDRTMAASYADKYCGNAVGCGNNRQYNSSYTTYASNDCANFVSQAQGDSSGANLIQDGYWYYTWSTASGSYDWINANGLYQYLINNPYGYQYNRGWLDASGTWSTVSPDIGFLQEGDVVGMDWASNGIQGHPNHVEIVVGFDSRGYPVLDAHTTDRYHIPIDQAAGASDVYYLVFMYNTLTIY